MKNIFKFLLFMIVGIVLYLLLNNCNSFSIGGPDSEIDIAERDYKAKLDARDGAEAALAELQQEYNEAIEAMAGLPNPLSPDAPLSARYRLAENAAKNADTVARWNSANERLAQANQESAEAGALLADLRKKSADLFVDATKAEVTRLQKEKEAAAAEAADFRQEAKRRLQEADKAKDAGDEEASDSLRRLAAEAAKKAGEAAARERNLGPLVARANQLEEGAREAAADAADLAAGHRDLAQNAERAARRAAADAVQARALAAEAAARARQLLEQAAAAQAQTAAEATRPTQGPRRRRRTCASDRF